MKKVKGRSNGSSSIAHDRFARSQATASKDPTCRVLPPAQAEPVFSAENEHAPDDNNGAFRSTQQSPGHLNPVVASLLKRSPHPYSSLSVSPSRQFAITACNDTLQIISIGTEGLDVLQTIPFAPILANQKSPSSASSGTSSSTAPRQAMSHDLFSKPVGARAPNGTTTNSMLNVVVTDVSWSKNLVENASSSGNAHTSSSQNPSNPSEANSFIAAAGSNGVIAIWKANTLLQKGLAPEAVLSQHTRAVNRLSWHPRKQLLLSASHDSTVRLWERKKNVGEKSKTSNNATDNNPSFSFFGFQVNRSEVKNYTWQCTTVFEPRSEPVRDIGWNPFVDDIFAIVTASGSLIVYNRYVKAKYLFKGSAHSVGIFKEGWSEQRFIASLPSHSALFCVQGEASALDWHPNRPYLIATGGSNDRLVKIWNLESSLKLDGNTAITPLHDNQNTISSKGMDSLQSMESDAYTDSSSHSWGSKTSAAMAAAAAFTIGSSATGAPLSRLRETHSLAVAAGVKRIKWRPPSSTSRQGHSQHHYSESAEVDENRRQAEEVGDRHDSMLAVAAARGAGSGFIALWSYHRPFMPLSVVEGHEEAVADLHWLDTPIHEGKAFSSALSPGDFESRYSSLTETQVGGRIWQHVLSVGKDGRCLIQSLVRGDRPISRVPPSAFAIANLSPFQKGSGSLQIFSVSQNVPSRGRANDFWLTGLRRDHSTALAPGIFREEITHEIVSENTIAHDSGYPNILQQRIPVNHPSITFNVVDQGELDAEGQPSTAGDSGAMIIAPEVVHMSRFASMYVLYPSPEVPTRSQICIHNAEVAQKLLNENLAQMWQMIAALLERAEIDSLADLDSTTTSGQNPKNPFRFAVCPTLHAILEDRANDGDVQTCVALCEVLEVVTRDQTIRVPNLEIQLVREWYLSYIDLLRDMCLFSHACSVIRSAKDPLIAGLNQNSTTIHEACQSCGKPILNEGSGLTEDGGGALGRRICKKCHKKIGRCFLCHMPVKGMFVWCPGCGHGGHLEHALSWFGGLGGNTMREFCPTGCGHKCNAFQRMRSFPCTDTLRDPADIFENSL